MSQPPAIDDSVVLPESRGGGLRQYVVDFIAAPARAKGALIGCLVLVLVSPSALTAMTSFLIPAYSMATGSTSVTAILLFGTLPLLIGPIVLPFAGSWVDRFGARNVAVPATILYAVLTALVPLSKFSIVVLALVLILASTAGFMASLAIVFKVISTWFPEHRGIGFALVGVVSSVASALLSPVFQWMINGNAPTGTASATGTHGFAGLGWEGAYYIVAISVAVLAVPAAVFLVSEPAGASSEKGARRPTPTALPGIPFRKALRSRTWIFIVLLLAFAAAGPITVRLNAVDLFGEHGFDAATVSLALSALFATSIVGLLVGGMVLDRTNRPWVVVPMLAVIPIGLVIAIVNQGSVPMLFLGLVLLGFATGAESAIGPFLIVRYFGLRSFAQVQGLTIAISTIAGGLSPYLVSAGRATSGSFVGPVLVLMVLNVIAVLLAVFLPRYPKDWRLAAPDVEPALDQRG